MPLASDTILSSQLSLSFYQVISLPVKLNFVNSNTPKTALAGAEQGRIYGGFAPPLHVWNLDRIGFSGSSDRMTLFAVR